MKKISYFIAGFLTAGTVTVFAASGFSDSGTFASWFTPSVNKMENHSIMTGYPDNSFRPNNFVNRAELATILDRFSTFLGKKMNEEPVFCTEEFRYGLSVYVQDQKGVPVTGAVISVDAVNSQQQVQNFEGGESGRYYGLGEREGYYNFTIEKPGFFPYVETVKLEKDQCHVISQTRTVTLISK